MVAKPQLLMIKWRVREILEKRKKFGDLLVRDSKPDQLVGFQTKVLIPHLRAHVIKSDNF